MHSKILYYVYIYIYISHEHYNIKISGDILSTLYSRAPDDGHSSARNMLSL